MGRIWELVEELNASPVEGGAELAGPAAPWTAPALYEQLAHPPGPQGRLWLLLDTWAGMDEAAWPEANIKALYEDLMDIFRDHPEAETWYREWRKAHPEARW